jgi:hypothetical protein
MWNYCGAPLAEIKAALVTMENIRNVNHGHAPQLVDRVGCGPNNGAGLHVFRPGGLLLAIGTGLAGALHRSSVVNQKQSTSQDNLLVRKRSR